MLTLTSPVETWAHRLAAGAKLAALAAVTTGLFLLTSPWALVGSFTAAVVLYLTGGGRFALTGLRQLAPLWPFVVIVGLWHLWTGDMTGGAVILERLARPLAPILPPRRLALAFALVIRFIPVMLERMGQIRQSWSARSPRRPRWRVMVPATLAALDDADRVAEALRARGGAG